MMESAHNIPIKRTTPFLASLYIREVVRLHGVPSSIVSDRDPLFTSEFWRSLQKALGMQQRLSTVYHSQTDGQTERVNQVGYRFLISKGTWEEHLPLVEVGLQR